MTHPIPDTPSMDAAIAALNTEHERYVAAEGTLDDLADLQAIVGERDDQARMARDERDAMIRRLVEDGVTAYRIAKTIGISQQAVAKILH